MVVARIYMKLAPESKLPWDCFRQFSRDPRNKYIIGRFFSEPEIARLEGMGLEYIDAVAHEPLYGQIPAIAAVDAVKMHGFDWLQESEDVVIGDLDHTYEPPPASAVQGREYVIGEENRFVHCRTARATRDISAWFVFSVLPVLRELHVPEFRHLDTRVYYAVIADVMRWCPKDHDTYGTAHGILARMFWNVPPEKVKQGLDLHMVPCAAYWAYFRHEARRVASITEDYKGTQYQEDHEVYDQPSPYIGWTRAFADTPVPPVAPSAEFEEFLVHMEETAPCGDRDFLVIPH